jgi:hypothetical protein
MSDKYNVVRNIIDNEVLNLGFSARDKLRDAIEEQIKADRLSEGDWGQVSRR